MLEMANHMKEVAAILGLELYEEFLLKDVADNYVYSFNYRITDEEIECFDTVYGEWKPTIDTTYRILLTGRHSIIKKPWKPNDDDIYYVPNTIEGRPDCLSHMWGIDPDADERFYNLGLVCRDDETAEKMAEFMLEAVKKYGESNEK